MTLLELFALLRKHLAFVAALPIVTTIVAAVYLWGFVPNQYTASVSIFVLSHGEQSSSDTGQSASSDYSDSGLSYSELQTAQLLANDFAELAKNEQVQKETASALGMDGLGDFKVDITSSTSTRVIKVQVTGEDPESCKLVANKLTAEMGDTAVRLMGVEAVNVVNEAQTPVSPSGPPRAMYTLVAFLAALFAAIALVVLRDMVNTTIRSEAEITELGVPVIGRFPFEKRGGRRR